MPLRFSISWDNPRNRERNPPHNNPSETIPAENVLYDVAFQRLSEQMTRNDTLDAKAAAAFSFGGTVLPISFGLLSISDRNLPRCYLFKPLLYGAGGAYVFVLVFSVLAYLLRRWSLRPHLPTLQTNCDSYSDRIMRQWTANEYLLSIEHNEPRLGRKARYVGLALFFSIVEAILLTLAAITTL